MSVSAVIGMQWGDEGKGKVVDCLAENAEYIVRFQGGSNAGHTVVIDDNKYILHLLPSGILREGRKCLIGAGVVVDPFQLFTEIQEITDQGIDVQGRISVDYRTHLVMPYHKKLDIAKEKMRGSAKIGTTARGIGPTYMDMKERSGFRLIDIFDDNIIQERLRQSLATKNPLLESAGETPIDFKETVAAIREIRPALKPFISDCAQTVKEGIARNCEILFEGAQGSLLDNLYGTYPFVTSSHTFSGGIYSGIGLGGFKINRITGIVKAYTTRVGSGPFPTEMEEEMGSCIQQKGGEFGATTGRPRRCGWLDLPALRYITSMNGVTDIAITKLDVLSGLDSIKVCTDYEYPKDFSFSNVFMPELATPVYSDMKGWGAEIFDVRSREHLPESAKNYLDFIREQLGISISLVSVGQKRAQVIDTSR